LLSRPFAGAPCPPRALSRLLRGAKPGP
jgi:hypothetical protein